MKKTAFLILTLISVLSLLMVTRQGYCAGEPEPAGDSKQLLVNLEKSQIDDHIRDIDRRVDDLERDKRFQDERIRNLERTVNDLRRER